MVSLLTDTQMTGFSGESSTARERWPDRRVRRRLNRSADGTVLHVNHLGISDHLFDCLATIVLPDVVRHAKREARNAAVYREFGPLPGNVEDSGALQHRARLAEHAKPTVCRVTMRRNKPSAFMSALQASSAPSTSGDSICATVHHHFSMAACR